MPIRSDVQSEPRVNWNTARDCTDEDIFEELAHIAASTATQNSFVWNNTSQII